MANDEMPAEGAPVDPGALIRSRPYRVILVFAAIIGVLVSLVGVGAPGTRPRHPGGRV
jgi:hypothetical protein